MMAKGRPRVDFNRRDKVWSVRRARRKRRIGPRSGSFLAKDLFWPKIKGGTRRSSRRRRRRRRRRRTSTTTKRLWPRESPRPQRVSGMNLSICIAEWTGLHVITGEVTPSPRPRSIIFGPLFGFR